METGVTQSKEFTLNTLTLAFCLTLSSITLLDEKQKTFQKKNLQKMN